MGSLQTKPNRDPDMNSLAIFQVLYVPAGKEIHIYERESWNKTQSLSAETEVCTVNMVFSLISAQAPLSAHPSSFGKNVHTQCSTS